MYLLAIYFTFVPRVHAHTFNIFFWFLLHRSLEKPSFPLSEASFSNYYQPSSVSMSSSESYEESKAWENIFLMYLVSDRLKIAYERERDVEIFILIYLSVLWIFLEYVLKHPHRIKASLTICKHHLSVLLFFRTLCQIFLGWIRGASLLYVLLNDT